MSEILTFGNEILSLNGEALSHIGEVPIPEFTIRCKFSSGYIPTMGDTQTLIDPNENIWDITKNSTDMSILFRNNTDLIEVLGGNTTGITSMLALFSGCTALSSVALFDTSSCTDMDYMFASCTSLTTVPLFDTRLCTIMRYMFSGCYSLATVPLFDTSSCTNMIGMFSSCYAVESGALALYQQASTQTTVPAHTNTFSGCGLYTESGRAERAQIPTSWGGDLAE